MSNLKQGHEPLLRIVKRSSIHRPTAYAIRVAAVLLSLLVSGLFIFAVTKLNPVEVYKAMFAGGPGSRL